MLQRDWPRPGPALLASLLVSVAGTAMADQAKGRLAVSVQVVAACTASSSGANCTGSAGTRSASSGKISAVPASAPSDARVVVEDRTVTIVF